nr:MAG TPA: hypothetical protein [Microviridae sp.]
MRTRAKRTRAHARPFRRYCSQAHKRRIILTCCRSSSRQCGKVEKY